MNYSKLLEGKTKKQIYEIADNWRNRTHRIQEAHKPSLFDRNKAFNVWTAMIDRVVKLAHIIRVMETPKEVNFPSGGLDFKSGGHETIIINKTLNN